MGGSEWRGEDDVSIVCVCVCVGDAGDRRAGCVCVYWL
jgi:hypothetical protein